MAKKYDVESFLDDVEGFLKTYLNAQITLLNSEKGADPVLLPIADEAYFLQTLNDRVANYNPFLFYGIDQVQSEGIGPATRKQYLVNVIIVMSDMGEDLLIAKRLLRYSRVLEDLFENKFAQMGNSVKLKVQSLVPVSFKLVNSSDDYRAVGVTLDFTLA